MDKAQMIESAKKLLKDGCVTISSRETNTVLLAEARELCSFVKKVMLEKRGKEINLGIQKVPAVGYMVVIIK